MSLFDLPRPPRVNRRDVPSERAQELLDRWLQDQHARLVDIIDELAGNAGAAERRRGLVDLRDFNGLDLTGVNDTTGAVNTALTQAKAAGMACYAPGGEYRVGTVLVPSGVRFFGDGAQTVFASDGSDDPILKSKNLVPGSGDFAQGHTHIHHLHIEGSNDQSKSDQDGIRFRDYFSKIHDVKVNRTGGHAIWGTSTDDDAVSFTTGANNWIYNLYVDECLAQVAVQLGDWGTTPGWTDGFFHDVYVNTNRVGTDNTGYIPISIGNAAGWFVDRIHSYVYHPTRTGMMQPRTCMALHSPWHAHIGELYLEEFTHSGLYLYCNNGPTSIRNVSSWPQPAVVGASAIYVDSATGNSVVQVNSVNLSREVGTTTVYAITADHGARVNVVAPPTLAGTQAGTFTNYHKLNSGTVWVPNAAGAWVSI